MKRTVLTYGTFDLFHIGHLRVLQRLKDLGDELIVGVSTDEFNAIKGKKTVIPFESRAEIVGGVKFVDKVIAESSWEQKVDDIRNYNVAIFGIGDDWKGKFDYLTKYCEVAYLPRTDGVSSTELKKYLKQFNEVHVSEMKKALDTIADILTKLQ